MNTKNRSPHYEAKDTFGAAISRAALKRARETLERELSGHTFYAVIAVADESGKHAPQVIAADGVRCSFAAFAEAAFCAAARSYEDARSAKRISRARAAENRKPPAAKPWECRRALEYFVGMIRKEGAREK